MLTVYFRCKQTDKWCMLTNVLSAYYVYHMFMFCNSCNFVGDYSCILTKNDAERCKDTLQNEH